MLVSFQIALHQRMLTEMLNFTNQTVLDAQCINLHSRGPNIEPFAPGPSLVTNRDQGFAGTIVYANQCPRFNKGPDLLHQSSSPLEVW